MADGTRHPQSDSSDHAMTAAETTEADTADVEVPEQQTDQTPLVRLDSVMRTYGGIPVLDRATLSILPGLTAVIGPNGSGKSTLLRTLAGVTVPTKGAIHRSVSGINSSRASSETTIDGRENTPVEGRKRIGYLPQQVPFRSGFTARETLAFYARFVDADPEAALASIGLEDAGDRRVEALSGGMTRLLGIAQATLGDPQLVVLDEPASGLDPGMRERAFDTAAAHADERTAVVVSSHDLELVDAYADTVVALNKGSVVASGPLDRLKETHEAETTRELYRSLVGSSAVDTAMADDASKPNRVHVTGVSER